VVDAATAAHALLTSISSATSGQELQLLLMGNLGSLATAHLVAGWLQLMKLWKLEPEGDANVEKVSSNRICMGTTLPGLLLSVPYSS
jgi:hypothetical protein